MNQSGLSPKSIPIRGKAPLLLSGSHIKPGLFQIFRDQFIDQHNAGIAGIRLVHIYQFTNVANCLI